MNFLKRVVVVVLMWEARLVLWRYKPKIIAVTGSVGKTTTKDAIYAALSSGHFIRKSEKSFNSEFGVPLTILGLENAWRDPLRWGVNLLRGIWLIARKSCYPEWLILEVGADRPGDIRSIAKWLRPHIVVITGVPDIPVHVEFFRSPEELAREKRALAEHMDPEGTLILNGDDERMVALCKEFEDKTLTYGLGKHDWRATGIAIAYEKKTPTGERFKLHYRDQVLPASISGALGKPRVLASLAAFAVADRLDIDPALAADALSRWVPPPGRMRIIRGANGSTIIDDTYNSSPAALHAALATLKDVKAVRKIGILGDMLELGKYASEAHRKAGESAANSCDMLFTIGFRSRATAEAARDAGLAEANIRAYEQNESRRAGQELRRELREGDVVLVKGSQAMRMERTVEALMAEPEKAWELLVRQEPEWLIR